MLRRKHGRSLKDAVDDVLRRGLRAVAEDDRPRPAFVTKSVDLGPVRLSLDNIADALTAAEDADGDFARFADLKWRNPLAS